MISTGAGVMLGLVMCLAGSSKIVMGERWPIEARSMRAPRFVVPFVPWVEIIVGALLVARVAPFAVGLVASGVIAIFTTLILLNVLTGHRPVCACFGHWRATPLGWGHVVRNGFLLALAVISALG